MPIKIDSDVMLFVATGLCDCLKVCHHKTSDTLRLALYQIINRNWQKYKQGIMPQSQLFSKRKILAHIQLRFCISKTIVVVQLNYFCIMVLEQ